MSFENLARRLCYVFILGSLASSMVACSLVPGTYLGVAPDVSETEEAYVYDTSGAEDVKDRADIYAITPRTISELSERRRHAEATLERARMDASLRANNDGYQYRVGAQDVLNITVWNHPEINNPAGVMNVALSGRVVNSDGTFFFPYAGKVVAAGKTVQQIREDLTAKLSKVLVEPQVDVAVLTYRSKRAFVVGQVERPGMVPITDVPLTVTDIITQSGGLKPEADLRAATLMRDGKSIPINLYSLYYEGEVQQNLRLESGDILTIPENRYNKIFVLGEVTKPQSVLMPRGRISLAEALSDAGGFNPLTANAGQMYVIRSGKNGKPEIWHLNAASPDALVLADRFDLEPRDIVYVDPAGVARFSRVINNIIPTATVIRATVQN